MDEKLGKLLKQAEEEQKAGRVGAERSRRTKAFIEQLQDDLNSIAYFDRNRVPQVGSQPITDDDEYIWWAEHFCEIGRRIVQGNLDQLVRESVPTGEIPHQIAIEIMTLACDQNRHDLKDFLRRAVAVDGLWPDVAFWIHSIAQSLSGSAAVVVPDGWKGPPPDEPVLTLEQFRVWLKGQLVVVRTNKNSGNELVHIPWNAHMLLEQLGVADRPHVPKYDFKSTREVEAELMKLDRWAGEELATRPVGSRTRLFVEDIFPKTSQVSGEDVLDLLVDGRLEQSEDEVQKAFEKALAVAVHKKDWGGEQNDLYTCNIQHEGIRLPTAFLLKGNGLPARKLEIRSCGSAGDQIVRLFQTSAELFVVQFIGEISEMVIRDVESKAELLRMQGKRAWFCIIDGQDTARMLKAHDHL